VKPAAIRIEVESREVVNDIDRVGADLDDVVCRKARSPSALVVIAADRADRCKVSQHFQDGWAADVATVNDEPRVPESI
jgi:hypothetical protein